MDRVTLLERLRRVPGLAGRPGLAAFDPGDDGQVDDVAGALLQRFHAAADTEAFTLLYELTRERLARTAEGIARRLHPGSDPEDLAAAFMTRLFADVRRPRHPVRRFMALARVSMRNEVLDQLRRLRRARDGGLDYHDTLGEVPDPAEQAAHHEEDALLRRYGRRLLAEVSRCFAQLEPRDQRVLVAREILGFSYDRVALALGHRRGQVGMVLRRARQRLADKLVLKLTASGHRLATEGADPDDKALPLDAAQAEVLARLLGNDRLRHVTPLVQRMLDLSAVAGRRRLADLVYELAKACLLSAPGASARLLVREAPRARAIVVDDVRQLTARLRGLTDEGLADGLPDDPALGGDALTDARHCLDVLARLEGRSGRQQVALALVHVHAAQLDEAEAILRPLLDATELPPATRQNVVRNLTLTLLRQERYGEARALAVQAAEEWPDDPVRLTNLCFCAARLGAPDDFERHVVELLAVQRAAPTERVSAWIDIVLPGLAVDLGLDAEHIAHLAADTGEDGGTRA